MSLRHLPDIKIDSFIIMNKNSFRRWGSIGLIAIMSTVFLFQNNSMIKRNAVISDLKTSQVVAYSDDDGIIDDAAEIAGYIELAIIMWGFVENLWEKFCEWYDEGYVYCKCHPNSTSDPCVRGHRFNTKRTSCHTELEANFSESCSSFNSNCPSN